MQRRPMQRRPMQLTTLLHRMTRRRLPPPPVGLPARGPHVLGALERACRQRDGSSCGAAVLAMIVALGDPAVMRWLTTGALEGLPPELEGATPEQLAVLAAAPAERRCAALQRVLKRRAIAGPLGLSWPAALGTPPWGLARVARFPGVVYRNRPLDDTDRAHLDAALDLVASAAELGIPVPLYTGGDTSRGWSTAVPRHVVLVVGTARSGWQVWEPGAGRRHDVTRAALANGRPHPALGGWAHLTWAVLPEVAHPLASAPLGGHDG